MGELRKYTRRAGTPVTAVQIALETEGFTYQKWGDTQRAKPGDWLLNNGGDVYTVDGAVFAATYREVSPGRFVKDQPVWARPAETADKIATKEGATHYQPGDMIVFNDADEQDGYAMTAASFAELYEPVD